MFSCEASESTCLGIVDFGLLSEGETLSLAVQLDCGLWEKQAVYAQQ